MKRTTLKVFFSLLFMLVGLHLASAQEKDKERTQGENKIDVSQWHELAGNPNLTFAEITRKTDSLFSLSKEIDTAEDGEAMRYARWRLFWQHRLEAKTGKIHSFPKQWAATNKSNSAAKNLYWRSNCSDEDQGQPWDFIGPQGIAAPHLGRVDKIVINPNDKNEIYISNKFGGLWKTTNGGDEWVCLTDNNANITGLGVSNFTVDFTKSPNKIYAVVGYAAEAITVGANQIYGLFISNDDGQTFNNYSSLTVPSFDWDLENGVNDIQVYPHNTSYLFITTRYKILRIYNDNQLKILADFSNTNNNPGSQFRGFHNITFLQPTPWPNQQDGPMFVTTLGAIGQSNYKTNAFLFKTNNCMAITPAFTDITSNIAAGSFNVVNNSVSNNSFTSGSGAVPTGWIGFEPWGQWGTQAPPLGDGVWEWTNSGAENYFSWSPTSLLQGLCLETSVPGNYAGTSVPVSFTAKVDLPVGTRLVVKLKDINGLPYGPNDHSCNNAGTLTPLILYDSDNDPTITNAHNSNWPIANYNIPTYNTNLGNGLHYGRLVFEVQFKPGYTANQRVRVDDVIFTQRNVSHLVAGSKNANSSDMYLMAIQDGVTHVMSTADYGSTWTNNGNFPVVGNWGNFYLDMVVSKTDPYKVYNNNGLTPGMHYIGTSGWTFSGDAYGYGSLSVKPWNPNGTVHDDVRSLATFDNGNGTEDVFAGHDGGLSVWRAATGTWECLTCEDPQNPKPDVFDCGQSFGISSDIHSGDVMISSFDNGIKSSNIQNYKSWDYSPPFFGGDGWFVKYIKRNELAGGYILNESGGADQNIDLIVPLPYNNIFTANIRPVHLFQWGWFTKPKTTFDGEYYTDYHVFRLDIDQPTNTVAWRDRCVSDPNQNFTSDWSIPANTPISAMAAHPNKRDIMIGYASGQWGGANGYFFSTINGGTNWVNIQNPFHNYIAVDMCIDPVDYNGNAGDMRAWAGMSWYGGWVGMSAVDRVFQGEYINGSWTWSDYSSGLPDGPVNCVVYDEQSKTLFAGTDIGVYARDVADPNSTWRCFSKNLPNSMIMDMEISYCTGKLYATCYGRGAWSADLPPSWHFFSPNDEGNTMVISSTPSQPWSGYRAIDKTVIVENGVKLTITGTVNMARGKHIVVNPGGVLVVDGGLLTNECNRMWGGIVIEGDPNQHQLTVNVAAEQSPVQGLVILRNNARIENAYVGVYVGGAYYDGDDFPQYTGGGDGGYLHATNTTFRNCRMSVFYATYSHNQGSTIDGCTFEGTDILNNEVYTNYDAGFARRYGAKDFIAIWGCNGPVIKNSTFRQVISPDYNPDIDLRGTAIVTSDAGYTIDNNTFTNVSRGVCALGYSGNTGSIIIENNTFRNAWRSVSSRVCRNVYIAGNTIDVGESLSFTSTNMSMEEDEAEGFCLNACGIFVSHTDEFTIVDNTISEFQPTPVPLPTGCQRGKMGIVINATNDDPLVNNNPGSQHAYRVYRNILSTDYGIIANQDCRGVQIRCNDLQQVEAYGIEVSDYVTDNGAPPSSGQLSDQGYCLTGTTPAGNSFNPNYTPGGGPCTDEHMFVLAPVGLPSFTYSHHNIAPFIPMCYNAITIQANACPQTCAGGPACCPDPPIVINPPDEGGKMIVQDGNILERIKDISVRVSEAEQKIMVGNKPELYSMLNTPGNSSREVRDVLLSAGAVLSDSLLVTTINRIPILDYMDIKAILTANASLHPDVWNAMVNRYPALATDKEMIEAQKHQSPKKVAEGQLLDLAYEKGLLIMQQVIIYSKNAQWQKIAELYEMGGKPHMALPYYVKMGDLSKARSAADRFGDEDYRNLIKMQIDRMEAHRAYSKLSENEKEIVERIASRPNEYAGEAARSLFWLTEGYVPRELMPMLHSTNIQKDKPTAGNAMNAYNITLHPNPANSTTTISNSNSVWGAGVTIAVYDITGRQVFKTIPDPTASTYKINTALWLSGVYVINIKTKDQNIVNLRLVISK